jgi:shikimate dehydrogenase
MVYSFKDFKTSKKALEPHYFVVGNPIGHSLSPLMHQTALDYHEIAANYFALELQHQELTEFITWMNRDEFMGCNITIPYKNYFIDVVDHVDDFAREIGVINTVAKSEYSLIGHNTDVYGFLSPLHEYTDDLEGGRAVVFGTGGAANAVLAGLEEVGIEEVIFVSRNPSLAKMNSRFLWTKTVDYNQWQSYVEEASLIVNTTPLGMNPKTDQSPVSDEDFDLLKDKICYDLVYNPLTTKFLKKAEESGAKIINGLEMLMMQGNRSFEIWTGKSFPFDEVKSKLIKELNN